MDTPFLTAVDIAKMLKISKALAYRLIAQREIHSVRFGRTVRVNQEDLEAFIASKSLGTSLPAGNNLLSIPRKNP